MLASSSCCTDAQFDAQVGTWCDEVVRTKNYAHAVSILSRAAAATAATPSSGAQATTTAKLAQLVNFLLEDLDASPQARQALLHTLRLEQVPTRLLSKHHVRLTEQFQSKMETERDCNSARLFALLSAVLQKPDWSKTFETLAALLEQSLAKKRLIGFQNSVAALGEFFAQKRAAIQPGRLVLACRKAVDVNAEFGRTALCLLQDLSRRLGRSGLPWASVCCEAVEVMLEEGQGKAARESAYEALACLMENFGLGVASKLAPALLAAVKQDFKSKEECALLQLAGLASMRAYYQTGAASTAPIALRTELDQVVLQAATAVLLGRGGGGSATVQLRASFLDCLALACTTPAIAGDSQALRPALSLLQSVIANAQEDSSMVKPSARRALAICAFRTSSALPPVRHVLVPDVTPHFPAMAAAASNVAPNFSSARFLADGEQAAAEAEVITMTTTTTTTTTTTSMVLAAESATEESESEEEEEESEQYAAAASIPLSKRIHLDPATNDQHESESDSDNDDIPAIV